MSDLSKGGSESDSDGRNINENPRVVVGAEARRSPPGILRMDRSPRSPRSANQTFINIEDKMEPSSPQPSIDRLSVTFAIAEDQKIADSHEGDSTPSTRMQQHLANEQLNNNNEMQRNTTSAAADGDVEAALEDDDNYSASACAIMQRRASSRRQSRRKRRPSSPFGPEMDNSLRRRSSALTTSSADTAISIEESASQEQIFERLKMHKEVLSGVKQEPWPLYKKMRLVRQAKAYVRRHEGALQERLAQSRTTKDIIARASLYISKELHSFRREAVNLQTWVIPWELRIKEIESHFGSAVASYFTFLRWLFWINLVIFATLTAFVAVPEILTADKVMAGERKIMLPEEKIRSKHFLTLWEFEGVLRYSPLFYGWYTNQDSGHGYRLPLAYFFINLIVYTYSFVAILRKMAANSRLSKLSEKDEECAFSWKLFTGWDFTIGNHETAHNRVSSLTLGFKETLLEEAEKQKDKRDWKTVSIRVFVNLSVFLLFALSAYAVIEVVARSTELSRDANWWSQNEITIVMSLISFIFPFFFEILGMFERYHPRKQLRLQLARIMVLNLLNLYSLIFALFDKISDMDVKLQSLKPKEYTTVNNTVCKKIVVPCDDTFISPQVATLASLSLLFVSNATSAISLTSSTSSTTMSPNTTIDRSINNRTSEATTRSTIVFNPFNETINEYYSYKEDDTHPDYDYYDKLNYSDVSTIDLLDYNLTMHNSTSSDELTTNYYVDLMTNSSDILEFDNVTSSDLNYTDFTLNPDDYATDDDFLTDNMTTETTEAATPKTVTSSEVDSTETTNVWTGKSLVRCYEKVCETVESPLEIKKKLDKTPYKLDLKTRKELRRLCWETMFGQELAKLTVMDLALTILGTLGMDFFRAVFIRLINDCWCWDLEKKFPKYGDFKIAENILHLVNNQGLVWMGMFFSPGLAVLNLVKLGILMYLRSWAVLTCNVPHEIVFKASRSNNFYLALLLTMLFLCVLPVGYAIVWVEPSWHCGPFSGYKRIYHYATQSIKELLPQPVARALDYIASPSIVIPLIALMSLTIYYMVSLTNSLREANNDLKIQLRHERTEERRKVFKIAEKRRAGQDNPFTRWKKILPVVPSSKASSKSTIKDNGDAIDYDQNSLTQELELYHQQLEKKRESEENPVNGECPNQREIVRDFGDSMDSSEFTPIPEIRISETDGTTEPVVLSTPPE